MSALAGAISSFCRRETIEFQGKTVLVALSGGRDSVALLCALMELSAEKGFAVAAGHYNHHLRSTAQRDEDFVRSFCAGRGIPLAVGGGDVAAFAGEMGLSTEEAARTLRYRFLEETAEQMGADFIATAHHAGDNAETVLMNLLRGTGLRGLGGIPPVRGRIIRPLLEVSRDEINNYINLDSFIEYWLVYEIAQNQEPNNPGSCYMHYNNLDGKLYMGPVWDFDFGSFLTSAQFDDGLYANKDKHFLIANSLWYCRLLQNTNVQDYIIQKWPTYKAAAKAVADEMAAMKTYLSNSAASNFEIWPMTTTGNADPNTERNMSFSDALDRINKNLNDRLGQLETLINNKSYN